MTTSHVWGWALHIYQELSVWVLLLDLSPQGPHLPWFLVKHLWQLRCADLLHSILGKDGAVEQSQGLHVGLPVSCQPGWEFVRSQQGFNS